MPRNLPLAQHIVLLLALIFSASSFAQLPAFPGAEGFGKYATGGRSGSVYHVTNLNNSGAGSLRDAVSSPNRIVVFDVAGVIKITERMIVSSNIYLAGQTAPGEGITVYGNGWSFSNSHNTICRYMKIRMGIVGSSGVDANGLASGHDVIFDHCSVSWGRDENFSINAATGQNITIQNCIISQGLLTHSAGGLIQCDGGITLYRNLYADNGTRNNKVKGVSQYVNNIVYNWSAGAYIMGGESSGNSYVNVTNNCFIQGPVNGVVPMSAGNSLFHIYAADNIADQNRNGVFDPYTIPESEYEGPPDFQATPYPYPTLPTLAANTLINTLLPGVGASLPYRDYADYYVVNEVKTFGTKGELIANENTLPFGAPTTWSLWAGTTKIDTDNDGMPDTWETANGTNPAVNDAMTISGIGYTNIENYINGINAGSSQDYLRTPMKLKQDSATQTTLYLSWLDYTEKEQGYIVERKVNGIWGQIGVTGVDINHLAVTGLQPEETGIFRVKAYNATMESGYSNELIAKTKPIEVSVLDPVSFMPDLTWTGAINQDWDKITNNWNNNSNIPAVFNDSSKLLFPEAGAAGATVNITAQMGANDILVNSNGNYTLSGVGYIAGSKSVNKIGSGTLSLQTNNTYTGATVLREGTIAFNKLANGGDASSIGASLNYGFNWVWKGGKWIYTGGSVTTDRNAIIDATTEFNISNSASTVTLTGVLSGEGGLTKSGPGKLILKSINPYSGETIINGGTIEVIPVSSATEAEDIIDYNVAIGTSNVLRLHNGTYKTSNGSTTIMENYPLNLYVDDNTVNGFEPFRNANLSMTVHGNGTLTYAIPYLRELIQGDWSDFTGTLVANGINATDGSILMIDNGVGFPSNRVVTTGNTKIATFQNNNTIYLGGLSGNVGTMLSCGGTKTASFGNGFTTYIIGSAGTDETFSGVINNHLYGNSADGNGTTTIVKEGEGMWRLTGNNTYIGTTTVTGGKLIINGNNNGNGKVTVNDGAMLAGKGSITGEVEVAGTLEPGDSSINTFTLKDKLTLQSTAIISIDVNKTTNTWDKINVTSNISYNGTIKINFTGEPASGDIFKIFTTPATIAGSITQFDPAIPGPGLFWKFKQATGELVVLTPNFVEAPTNLTLNAHISTATSPSSVTCSWVDNSDNEDYFILERSTDNVNFADIAHPAMDAVNYSDVGVLPGITYFYRIKAHSPLNESAYSSIVSVTIPAANELPTLPATPFPANNATNVFLNGNTFALTWTANYADSFSVYLGTSSNALTKLADIPATSASYTPAILDANTKYYWRIDARNANGTTTGTVWNFKTANIPVTVSGDYRSVASGNWGSTGGATPVSTDIWEVFDGASWNATTTMPSGSTPTVTIRTGHIVKLNATTATNNLVIESGASLISGTSDGSGGTATQRNIRVISSINNFGIVGSGSTTTDRINFEGYKDNGTIYLTGTSSYFLNTFTVNGLAVNTEVVIDANINLTSSMRANFSTSTTLPWSGASQNDDNITITINEGKTVTMGSSGFLQAGSSPTTNTIGEFGTYTFNINGTLDMRGTGTSCIVAHATLAKVTTINVNGTWLMGNAIRFIPSGTAAPAGSLQLNIGTNGIVDAGARTIGSSNTATNIVVTNTSFNQTVFFNITGGGMLKTRVTTSDASYPVGSGNIYSPVRLNNSGTADIIGVGVKTGFDYPVGDATKVVNKQYTVVPASPGTTNLTISLGWITASQGSGFNPSGSLVQGRYNTGVWSESAATLSGAGTAANPYYARVAGNTIFGTFAVANASALLDVVAPDVTQPQDMTASNTLNQCSADISFSAQATDNFSVTSLKYYLDYNLAGQQEITFPRTFAVGTYSVTIVAKDASNNTTTKTFAITVNDMQKPGVTPGTINSCFTSQPLAEAAALAATIYSDNCTSNAQLAAVASTEGTCSAVITVTVTDAAGNSESVVYHTKIDNTRPELNDKPGDLTVSCDQVPPVPAITATDNCDGPVTVTVTSSSTKGSDPAQNNYYNYTITRTWEAHDGCENNESHTQIITVHDVTNPTARCKNIIVYLNAAGTGSITASQVDNGSSDNCSPVSLGVSPNSFTSANVGTNLVTLTATDVSGNTSTCQATVTVVDNIAPNAICKPATITLVNGVATLTAADIDNGSNDASGIQSLQVSRTSFSCADIGTKTVVLTVTDNNNNVSTCSTTVTVVGAIPSCSITSIPSNNTYTGGVPTNLYIGYGPKSTTLQISAPAASGAPYTYSWYPAAGLSNASSSAPVFTPTAEGTYTFTVTTTNKYGCPTTCSITICVIDIRVPGTKGKLVYVCQQVGHTGHYLTLPVIVNLLPLLYKFDNGFHLGSCNQTICAGNQLQVRNTPVETGDDQPLSSFNIAAFPNPSSGNFILQVTSTQKDPVTISIVNVFGKVVYRKVNVTPNSTILAGDVFAQGVYFLEAEQGDKKMMLKLIKIN